MLSTLGPNYTPSSVGQLWLATPWGQDQYLQEAFDHLPLNELDRVVTGHPIDFFPDWLAHSSRNDPHWEAIDFRRMLGDVKLPIHLISGWYDLFTRYLAGRLSTVEGGRSSALSHDRANLAREPAQLWHRGAGRAGVV